MKAKHRYEEERRSIRSMRESSIVEAAKGLFAQKGFDKTTMQDIADAIPLGIATVFRYFAKKEKLIVAVACSILRSQEEAFREVNEREGTCMDKLSRLFDLFISFQQEEHRENIRLIEAFESWAALLGDSDHMLEEYRTAFATNRELFGAILAQGKTDGSIRNDISVDDTLLTLINVFGSFTQKVSLSRNLASIQEATQRDNQLAVLKNVFLDYLQPR